MYMHMAPGSLERAAPATPQREKQQLVLSRSGGNIRLSCSWKTLEVPSTYLSILRNYLHLTNQVRGGILD
ncbi:hypothetical protein Y1Q_0009920 [Alligator mississippiensis]|uniref:Uncharacterized protein n=1 Tax=Alligator mississippiensis TaxID=8496 RepID=A0A151MXA1_ALLMI|nr:hypothetical protein Y1Q_0009920 [Alligator mississippiensis]